jgi:hypothetical protein
MDHSNPFPIPLSPDRVKEQHGRPTGTPRGQSNRLTNDNHLGARDRRPKGGLPRPDERQQRRAAAVESIADLTSLHVLVSAMTREERRPDASNAGCGRESQSFQALHHRCLEAHDSLLLFWPFGAHTVKLEQPMHQQRHCHQTSCRM